METTCGANTKHTAPMALKKIVPADEGADFCHRIVFFGREYCTARRPKCDGCPMAENCRKIGV